MNKLTAVELFSGAGLMAGGFKDCGIESIFAAELDSRAVKTYNYNIAPVAEEWDASDVKEGLSYDVLIAGPPCQGFSTLGRRDPKDKRNALSLKVFNWAKAHTPKVVVIENVPQFLNSDYWLMLCEKFKSINYQCVSWTLNAKDFGVAQNRKRSFTIFSRVGLPQEPVKANRVVSVREAFQGLSLKADGRNYHIAPKPTEIGLKRMLFIPTNGDKRDLLKKAPELCPPSWFKMGNQAVDVWGRMHLDRPANTIRCSFQSASKGRYLHPTENRVISLREGARIQGIPDSWSFFGDRSSIARQIGNGVPVPLARAVAGAVKEVLI